MRNSDQPVRHICTADDHQTAQDTRIAELRIDLADALAVIQEQNRRLAVVEHRLSLLEAAEVAL